MRQAWRKGVRVDDVDTHALAEILDDLSDVLAGQPAKLTRALTTSARR
jgi:hypothetical protein